MSFSNVPISKRGPTKKSLSRQNHSASLHTTPKRHDKDKSTSNSRSDSETFESAEDEVDAASVQSTKNEPGTSIEGYVDGPVSRKRSNLKALRARVRERAVNTSVFDDSDSSPLSELPDDDDDNNNNNNNNEERRKDTEEVRSSSNDSGSFSRHPICHDLAVYAEVEDTVLALLDEKEGFSPKSDLEGLFRPLRAPGNDQDIEDAKKQNSPQVSNRSRQSEDADGYSSEDESNYDGWFSDDNQSFSGDDFFEVSFTPDKIEDQNSRFEQGHMDSEDEDDSYLWSYFFSDSEDGSAKSGNEESFMKTATMVDSLDEENGVGESTDEDESLPPPSARKNRQNRAQEILSLSAASSRPPVLGSWVMTGERPFGIIDGISTRTLSPPRSPALQAESRAARNQSTGCHHQPHANCHHSAGPQTPNHSQICRQLRGKARTSFSGRRKRAGSSDLSELALDEFIYTSELGEDDGDFGTFDNTTGSNSTIPPLSLNIPLSAFRSRTSHQIPVYSTPYSRRISPAGSLRCHREAVITPVRSIRRSNKKTRMSRTRRKTQTEDRLSDKFNTADIVDELLKVGALSPLFGGL